jgi:hypothetical protein
MPGRTVIGLLLLAALLVACVVVVPSGTPAPSRSSTASTAASTSPTAGTASATRTATPGVTPSAPAPSASPDPALLELEATGCPGGVVLDWSPSTHQGFHHYTALRSPEREIATDYPPIAPAVDWGDTYATDRFVTSAVDASILPSATRWNYRVIAYAVDGVAVSASPVRSARIDQVADMGTLQVMAGSGGATLVTWQPFAGFSSCFSSYRVLFGIGVAPSVELSVISDQDIVSVETAALHAGTTYQLRVEAVRTTTLGGFVTGQTAVASYTVP